MSTQNTEYYEIVIDHNRIDDIVIIIRAWLPITGGLIDADMVSYYILLINTKTNRAKMKCVHYNTTSDENTNQKLVELVNSISDKKQNDFIFNLRKASNTVKTWPEWKQNIWGNKTNDR